MALWYAEDDTRDVLPTPCVQAVIASDHVNEDNYYLYLQGAVFHLADSVMNTLWRARKAGSISNNMKPIHGPRDKSSTRLLGYISENGIPQMRLPESVLESLRRFQEDPVTNLAAWGNSRAAKAIADRRSDANSGMPSTTQWLIIKGLEGPDLHELAKEPWDRDLADWAPVTARTTGIGAGPHSPAQR